MTYKLKIIESCNLTRTYEILIIKHGRTNNYLVKGGDKFKMEKGFARKSFISHFLCMLFLIIFLSNYVNTNPIFFGLQQDKEKITGTIIDEEGTPLPGVAVTLTPEAGLRQTTITSDNGQFRFINLSPGNYTIRAELQGFKTAVRQNIDVSFGICVPLTISMEIADIDETGGIPNELTMPDVRLPNSTKKRKILPPSPPKPRIPRITLYENFGLNPFLKTRIPKDTAECYYFGGKIFVIHGIARVGKREERLNNITEFPYGDKRYTQNSINVESGCVYAIRVGEKSNWKTLLVRVLEIFEDRIRIEYWVQNER